MEASTTRRPFGGASPKDVMSSRKGSLVLAAVIALIAGVLIFLFVDSRSTGGGLVGGGTTRVLVAKSLIPKGSSGEVVARQSLAVATTLESGDVKEGALADPAVLAGQAAVADIYPGQQVTATDFSALGVGLATKLGPGQRAVAVPVDPAHGLIGGVQTGDRVDIYVTAEGTGEPLLRTLLQDVLVLSAPGAGTTGNIILRSDSEGAAKLAFAADNGRVWVVLRPPVGARPTPQTTVTLDSLLAGQVPPAEKDED